MPVFVLIFWHERIAEKVYGRRKYDKATLDMRGVLRPEAEDHPPTSKTRERQALREKGLKLVTTFKWDPDKGTANF